MSDWQDNAKYILEALKRIEKKLDSQEINMERHTEQDAKNFAAIELKLANITNDLKWYSKVFAAIGSAVAIIVSLFIEMRKNG